MRNTIYLGNAIRNASRTRRRSVTPWLALAWFVCLVLAAVVLGWR